MFFLIKFGLNYKYKWYNRAEAVNPTINAINNKLYDLGKSTAESPIEGDFGGVPFLIKDLELQLKGQMMQCGSQSMKGFVSKEDSVTVQRMKAAGLVIFGKNEYTRIWFNTLYGAKIIWSYPQPME
jgi:Asp-tRNA(Asn)/Glu-tRNA(Gln) amidotransferase A subunit family amidase